MGRFSITTCISVPDEYICSNREELALLIGRDSFIDQLVAKALKEEHNKLREVDVEVQSYYSAPYRDSNFGPDEPAEVEIEEVRLAGSTVEVPERFLPQDVMERLEDTVWESLD